MAQRARPRLTYGLGDGVGEAEGDAVGEEDAAGLAPGEGAAGVALPEGAGDGLAAGTLPRRPQDSSQATLAPAIQTDDGYIRWDEPAPTTRNRIRVGSRNTGAGVHVPRSSTAVRPRGITRDRFPASPPPVTCANVRTSASAASARQSLA